MTTITGAITNDISSLLAPLREQQNAKPVDTSRESTNQGPSSGVPKTPPVTGTTNQNLSSENLRQLISSNEVAETSEETRGDNLHISTKHGLEDIANDPEYAAERARTLGTAYMLVLIPEDQMPKNGDPASVWTAFARKTDALKATMEQDKATRTAFYDSKVAEGLPPAEIYAQLLSFVANDTQRNEHYDNVSEKPAGTRSSEFQDQYSYLRQLLNQNHLG